MAKLLEIGKNFVSKRGQWVFPVFQKFWNVFDFAILIRVSLNWSMLENIIDWLSDDLSMLIMDFNLDFVLISQNTLNSPPFFNDPLLNDGLPVFLFYLMKSFVVSDDMAMAFLL